MAQSYFQLYIHIVWHTKGRRPVLGGRLEETVRAEIRHRLHRNDLLSLAVGSAWDHVHLFAGWNGSVAVGEFVSRAKGASSYRWNQEERTEDEPELYWQRGYGAVSVDRPAIDAVIEYIDRQKQLHRRDDLRERFEQSRAPSG